MSPGRIDTIHITAPVLLIDIRIPTSTHPERIVHRYRAFLHAQRPHLTVGLAISHERAAIQQLVATVDLTPDEVAAAELTWAIRGGIEHVTRVAESGRRSVFSP